MEKIEPRYAQKTLSFKNFWQQSIKLYTPRYGIFKNFGIDMRCLSEAVKTIV